MPAEPCDILIVEDDPADAELMVRSLRRAGLANPVTVVQDGAAAVDFLLGTDGSAPSGPRPRVVFLDLKLPKLSGLEVLARLRAAEATKRLPVVVVSSSHLEPDIAAAYELGVNSYVVKPVEFEAFAEATVKLGFYWLLVNIPPA